MNLASSLVACLAAVLGGSTVSGILKNVFTAGLLSGQFVAIASLVLLVSLSVAWYLWYVKTKEQGTLATTLCYIVLALAVTGLSIGLGA